MLALSQPMVWEGSLQCWSAQALRDLARKSYYERRADHVACQIALVEQLAIAIVSIEVRRNMKKATYRPQRVSHVCHGCIGIAIFLLYRCVFDIKFELRGRVGLHGRTAFVRTRTIVYTYDTHSPASRSASVIASIAEGGTVKPSASFVGCKQSVSDSQIVSARK